MVRRLLPLSLTLLAGCALSPPLFAPATPVEVQMPVYEPIYCTPPPRTNPTLPIASLSGTALPADTMRAYAATVVLLKGTVRQRDAIIDGCEAPDNPGDSVRVSGMKPNPPPLP